VDDAPRHDQLQGERTLYPLDCAKLKYLDAAWVFQEARMRSGSAASSVQRRD
jgi:hypothetical protein